MNTAAHELRERSRSAIAERRAISDYDRYLSRPGVIRHPDGVLELPPAFEKLWRISEYLTNEHNAAGNAGDRRLKTYYRDGAVLLDAVINGDIAPPVSQKAIERLIDVQNREDYD